MKKKLTAAQLRLKQEFDSMMARHAKPLERGAKSKGVKGIAVALDKREAKHPEHERLIAAESLDTGYGKTSAKRRQQYTGDKMRGVSQMHKSNLVPVFSDEAAQDITKMRRG